MYLLIFVCRKFLINFRAVIVPELCHALIMLSRQVIVAITEQVFFLDLSRRFMKRKRHDKKKCLLLE